MLMILNCIPYLTILFINALSIYVYQFRILRGLQYELKKIQTLEFPSLAARTERHDSSDPEFYIKKEKFWIVTNIVSLKLIF